MGSPTLLQTISKALFIFFFLSLFFFFSPCVPPASGTFVAMLQMTASC